MKDRKRTKAQRIAEAFDRDTDPLAKFESDFQRLQGEGIDPLNEYVVRIQRNASDNVEATIEHYERVFRQWKNHMNEIGRHPACPQKSHVLQFIDDWLKNGNKPKTVGKKIERLNQAYEWWQSAEEFPHPSSYNPFEAARAERNLTDEEGPKKPPNLSLDEIRKVVQDINHIGDRALIGLQLKLGCRSSELGNIKLSEIHIDHPDVHQHYPELGSHELLQNRPNAVFIPSDRDENKRQRPTVLPLDKEARRILIDWLLVRPDLDKEWVFLTHNGGKATRTNIGHIWKKYWWPHYKYDDNAQYRSVSPHFARHRFSTYWTKEIEANRELVKYMRGDMTDTAMGRSSDALDRYVHTYYDDVEDLYRREMYQLHL